MKYDVNKTGYYGKFGGSYIPEMLYSNIEELNKNYLSIINTKSFNENFNYLLKHLKFKFFNFFSKINYFIYYPSIDLIITI